MFFCKRVGDFFVFECHLFLRDDASDNSSFLKRCIFETKVRIYIELTNKKVKKVLIKYIPN